MKKLLIFTITAAMLLSLIACAQSAKPDVSLDTPAQEQTVSGSTQIPNPWESYDTADAAANAAGFTLTAPEAISGSSAKTYQVMNSGDGEVIFAILFETEADGERAAYIRKAPGADDISGDYNDYAETETLDVNSRSVTMKGNDGLVNLALWTDGGYSYALNVSEGLSRSDIAALVAEIQ